MSLSIPSLIYGTAWKKEATRDLVVEAIRSGFKGIDTACQPKHYYEAGVGDALEILKAEGIQRDTLFIQTKFTPLPGQDPQNIPYDKNADLRTQVMQSFEFSKQNLKTDYVDSLVLHSPLHPFEYLKTVWQTMEEIAKDGGAKILGISNIYDPVMLKDLYTMAEIKPQVVQNRFYAETSYDSEIRAFCLAHDMAYQSFWTLTANPHILQSQQLQRLTLKYQKTAVQILFAYLRLVGVTVLTGTKNSKHMKQDLESVQLVLEDADIIELNALFEQA